MGVSYQICGVYKYHCCCLIILPPPVAWYVVRYESDTLPSYRGIRNLSYTIILK